MRAEVRRGRDPCGCGTSLGRAATTFGADPKERSAAPNKTISPSCAAALVSRAKTGNTARSGRGAQLRSRSRLGIARRCRPRVLSGIGLILTRLLSGSDRVEALEKAANTVHGVSVATPKVGEAVPTTRGTECGGDAFSVAKRLRERARARHLKPKSGPSGRSTAKQEHVSGKNVATRIARESLRALVRNSVDGRRQVLATPAAARRCTGGEPSMIFGVETVVVAAVRTRAAKVTRRA